MCWLARPSRRSKMTSTAARRCLPRSASWRSTSTSCCSIDLPSAPTSDTLACSALTSPRVRGLPLGFPDRPGRKPRPVMPPSCFRSSPCSNLFSTLFGIDRHCSSLFPMLASFPIPPTKRLASVLLSARTGQAQHGRQILLAENPRQFGDFGHELFATLVADGALFL